MQVERVGPAAGPVAKRKTAKADGFSQLMEAPESDTARPPGASDAPAATDAAASALPLALMTYESAVDRKADRQARRHGRAMLKALGVLQLAVLGDDAAASEALAALAHQIPEADDPALRLILREIGVRAAVELALHGQPANISIG